MSQSLGPRRTHQEWLEAFRASPTMPHDLSSFSHLERRTMLRTLLNRAFLIPSGMHAEVAVSIDEMLRIGLTARDPGGENFHQRCEEELEPLITDSPAVDPVDEADAICGCLLGCPGLAKTRTVRATLRTIRQTVSVTMPTPGNPKIEQIRYLYLSSPSEASVSDFASVFFRQANAALYGPAHPDATSLTPQALWMAGERKITARSPSRDLEIAIRSFVQQYGVGLLILDEVQNLDARFWHGREKLINSIVALVNDLSLSLFIVGSGAVLDTLFTQLRFGRRVGKRSHLWNPADCEAPWQDYVQGLLALQITDERAQYSDDIAEALWMLTEGLFDICNTLFEHLQDWLLFANVGPLTAEIVRTHGPQFVIVFADRIAAVRDQRAGKPCLIGDMRIFKFQ